MLHLQEWLYFGVWRWCIFLAGMGPIYFLAELLVHMLFLFAESHFFTLRYAFYYAVSVKVGTANSTVLQKILYDCEALSLISSRAPDSSCELCST